MCTAREIFDYAAHVTDPIFGAAPLIMVGMGFPMEAALALAVALVPVPFNILEKDDCRNTKISTVQFISFVCLSLAYKHPAGLITS